MLNINSKETVSVWMESNPYPESRPLLHNIQTKVCVIGAGIAGLSVAYFLAKEGKSVVVLDADEIGGRETRHTTAHLSNVLDEGFRKLQHYHGLDGARIAAESHSSAINKIEEICHVENIDCDFERLDGYLFQAEGGSVMELKLELAAAHQAGLIDAVMVKRAPVESFNTGPCLKFPKQAQFHPLKYLNGLVKVLRRRGVDLYSRTHVDKIDSGPRITIHTAGGNTVTAETIVLATNTPFNDLVAIHTKQASYRTYVIGARIRRGSVPFALYWDTMDPYHYVRLKRIHPDSHDSKAQNDDLLIIGGEDHKTGQDDHPEECFGHLETWARVRFPLMREIEYQWSGQIMEPNDGVAFIGRNPLDGDNVYIATGDSGHGMTHGTIAGMLISDMIFGRSNAWESLYTPSRVTLSAFPNFAKENLNVAAQYGEWFTGGELKYTEDLPPDTGAIMRDGLKKIAVYRDKQGELHGVSATCPHLGGIVHWNAVEKSWDCPCHGSRFDVLGKVLNGPAAKDLAAIEAPVETGSKLGTESKDASV